MPGLLIAPVARSDIPARIQKTFTQPAAASNTSLLSTKRMSSPSFIFTSAERSLKAQTYRTTPQSSRQSTCYLSKYYARYSSMSRSVTSIHSSLHASYQTLGLAPFFCPGSVATGESWPSVHLCYGQPFTSTTSQDRQWFSSGLIAHRTCHSRSSGTFKTIQDLCIWGIVGWRQSCLC